MGRSGTSLATHWVQALGLDVGSGFKDVKIGNINGSFEDAEFRKWHKELLRNNGMRGWLRAPRSGQIQIPDPLKAEGRALVEARNTERRQWAFKDPMASLVLRYWLGELTEPSVLFLYRDPTLVAESVIKLERNNQRVRRNKVAGLVNRARWAVDPQATEALRDRAVDAWLLYNGQAIEALEALEPRRRRVVNAAEFPNRSGELYQWVAASFDVVDADPIGDVYEPREMTKEPTIELGKYRIAERSELWSRLQTLG